MISPQYLKPYLVKKMYANDGKVVYEQTLTRLEKVVSENIVNDMLYGSDVNTNSSVIKTAIDTWYKNNLTSYTNYLSNDAIYCNDRSLSSGTGIGTKKTTYTAQTRISNGQPTLKCTNNSDKFTKSTTIGNGKLTKMIGLITSDEVMFDYIHEMRSRIIRSDAFDERILGVILFKNTMERDIGGVNTVKYLSNKGIPAFLKIDVGLEDIDGGVQLLKDIPGLEDSLENAKKYGIIGTKMRSVIKEYNEYGIKKVIEQQFNLAKIIIAHGLIPIIEPEVDIHAENKKQIETFMRNEILRHLDKTKKEDYLMFKFTLPEIPNFYNDLLRHKNVLRIVALSGGYERDLACSKLKQNKKMIASFSRALLEGLNVDMSDEEFNDVLDKTIEEIYEASVKKEK